MFEIEGKNLLKVESAKIRIYAIKNSGIDMADNVEVLTALSYIEFLYKAAVTPKKSEIGIAIIAVIVAKNTVL
tara:strand:+ start:538 stop:756 length:219 start_codon:yes stop_codon:yes gene_type:complete